MSAEEILLYGVCCVLAAVTQCVTGFGFGVVLVGLLPLFGVEIRAAVVLISILVVPNLTIALWQLRRHVAHRRVAWLLAGLPLGIPVGMLLLDRGSEALVRALLGAALIFAGVESFVRRRPEPRPTRPAAGLAAGIVSGTLGAAFGTGGPPAVIYVYRRHWSKEVTKASLMLIFAYSVGIRAVGYASFGWMTARLLSIGLLLCPVVIVATLYGERLFRRVSQQGFRRVVATMLIVLGLYQIGKAATLWPAKETSPTQPARAEQRRRRRGSSAFRKGSPWQSVRSAPTRLIGPTAFSRKAQRPLFSEEQFAAAPSARLVVRWGPEAPDPGAAEARGDASVGIS